MPVGRAAMSDVRFYGTSLMSRRSALAAELIRLRRVPPLALGDEAATADSCPHPSVPPWCRASVR